MRRLLARAHDNGLFLVYSNGIGVDDDEIRTGVLSLRTCFRFEHAFASKADDPRSIWTHPGRDAEGRRRFGEYMMSKTLLHRLFGLGKVPEKYAPTLREEGIILIDEGIGGSVTYKRFKAPGRRYSSWKKSWFIGCLVLTRQTFAAFAMTRPLIFVPLGDKRLSELRCSVQEGVTLLVTYDASLFNAKWSGIVECRFRTAKAQLFLEQLARHAA